MPTFKGADTHFHLFKKKSITFRMRAVHYVITKLVVTKGFINPQKRNWFALGIFTVIRGSLSTNSGLLTILNY